MFARMRFPACALLATCLATAALGAPADWVIDRFGTREGLPSSSVLDMVEGSDGYLWVATFGSLARFDGRRFVVLNSGNTPGLEANRFVTVVNDRNGDLLALAESGDVYRRHDGAFRRETHDAAVGWIAVDRAGTIWGIRGIPRAQSSLLVHVVEGVPHDDPRRVLSVPIADGEGRVWLVTDDGGITSADAPAGAPPVGRIDPEFPRPVPCPSAGAVLFARRAGARIVLASPEGAERASVPARDGIVPSFVDSRGAVWAATPGGAAMFVAGRDDPELVVPVKSGGPFHEDHSGTIWIGSIADGLWRVKPSLARVVVAATALGGVPNALYAADDGRIFVYAATGTRMIADDRLVPGARLERAIPCGKGATAVLGRGVIRVERDGRILATLEGPFGLRN